MMPVSFSSYVHRNVISISIQWVFVILGAAEYLNPSRPDFQIINIWFKSHPIVNFSAFACKFVIAVGNITAHS